MINHFTSVNGNQRKSVLSPYNAALGLPPDVTNRSMVSSVSEVTNVGTLIKGDFKKPNPWSYTVTAYRHYHGDMNTRVSGFVTNDLGVFYEVPLLVPSWDRSAVYNACTDKLVEAVRGGMDLSVDLLQGGQTARMFKSAGKLVNVVRLIPELGPLLKRLERLIKDPRGHNFEEELKTLSKTVSGKYLEAQFGWKPLLQSIYSIADESVNVVLNKIQNFKVQASLPMRDPDVSNFRDIIGIGAQADRYNIEQKQRCSMSIWMEVDEWDPARWSSLNPASIAWELMPYSFVIDWVYDVGGMLRRLETALIYGKKFKSGYSSELYFYACAFKKSGTFKTSSSSIVIDGVLSASIRSARFQRTVLSTMPFGRLPTVKVNLGSTQLLESAALLSQFLRPERVWKTHQIV